jgi:N12 class adenine-specific DNA methylase
MQDNPEKRKAHEQAEEYGVAKSLYKNLTDFGYTPDELGVKDEAEFVDKLGSPDNRKKVYDAISQAGEFDLGDYESYERSLADDYSKAFAKRRPQLFGQQRDIAKAADELHNAGNRITEMGYSFNPEAASLGKDPSTYGQLGFAAQRDDPSVYGQLGFTAQRGRNKEVAEAVSQYDNSELSIVQLKMQRDRLVRKLNERETAVREQYNKDREEKSPFVRWVESLNRAEQHGSFFPEDVLGQDKEANAYMAAISELNNAIKTVEDTRGNTSPGFWKGIWDGLSDGMKSFLTMSYEDINKGITAYDIASKNKGVAESDAEQEFVNAMATRRNFDNLYGQNYSSWYKYGNMTGEMFPFMLEIGLSPGSLFSAGSKGAAKIVGKQTIKEIGEQGVRKYIKANGVKGAGNVLVKNLGIVADDIGKAAITNATLGAGSVAADALGRMTGGVTQTGDGRFKIAKGKDIGEAAWQAGMSNLIEVYSEMLGGHFGGIERVIGDKLSKVFSPKWLTSVLSTGKMQSVKNLYGGVGKVFEQMGISDYFGEVGEEYAGQLLRTAFNLDDAYTVDADGKRVNLLFTKDFNKDILVGMALSMGVMGAAKGGLTAASYAKYNHDVNKADARCGEVFGQQEWQGIKNTIDNTTNEDMGALFNAIANDGTMNEREKMAAADYITKSMTLRGFNLSAARTGEEQSSELAKLNTSFSRGYNAQGTDKADIQAELQFFAERARNVLGDDFDRLDNADVATAIGIANSYSGDARTAAMDYLTAKQSYNGVEQKYKDTASFTEEMVRAKYGSITHTGDGMVHAATTIGGKRVYIISGNVVASYSDSTGVDVSNSDDSIIVADEEGNRSQISPKELLLLDDVQGVEPLIDLELSLTEQQSMMDRQRDFDGKVEPVSGVMYPFVSPTTGELMEAELQSTEDGQMQHEDGSYIIKTATGEVVPFASLEELQANVDEARKAKVRAKYAELQKQDEAETSAMPLEDVEVAENYRVDDEVVLEVDGVSINGVVQDYIPEDDTLIIDLDKPINGKYTIAITPEELASMAVSHNGRELERREPQQSAKDADGGLFAAPLSEQENGNGSNEEIAQTEQHSAVSMLPHDIDGNPIYEQGEPAVAFDAITEQCEGNVEVAMSVAESMLADKVKALKAVEKAKSKGGETVAEKIAAEKERMAAIEQAKKDVEAWQAIVEAGKIRQAAQAMGSRQAAVAPEVVADGTLNGVPDVIDDTPQEARARGYRRVNGHKVERQEPVAHSTGREVEVKFSNDKTVKGRAVLIEADELQPSHQGGQRNPVHFIDEAQPKERVDNASRAALNRMAAHIRPEEITSSVTAYTGAPTVNARGEVIQGNNRSGALKAMYAQHKDQAEKYKQYLLDNAERLGLDRAEIEAMKNPVLVNMVDVSDEEAVNLGQYEAKDTESGGVERIKPKNTVQKMGTDIGTFFNTLFASNEEDLSLAELIDKNGAEVLAYLNRKGYITDTQYKSAFDSKGNLTAEAKNDLRGIVVSHIFQNGNSRLEEMFNAMPAKAQKAILATAYRDNASPESERMMTEIQNSVRAFHALMQYDEFANARNYEAARKAVENWAKQYQYDDATGESYLPAEKFSNFALVLAAMYKGRTQKFVQDSFTDMYDLIQGTRKGDLFGTPDNTPRTLAQAIKEVLNIDYNENRNGQAGNNGVGIDTQKSERGRRGSNGDVGGREHSKGTEPQTDSGGRVGGDSQGNGEVVESQSFLDVVRTLYSKGKEVASKLFQRSFFDIAQTPRFMQELGLRGDKFTIKYGVIARHISKDNSHSLSEQVWEQLPQALQNPFAVSRITDREDSYRIYTTLETENSEYVVVGVDVKNAGREIEVNAISTVFGRRNNANLSKNEEVIYRSKKITPEQSSLLERPNFVQYPTGQELSDDKGTTKTGNGDELGEKIAQAEAEVDTDPTEKQKEAGNYKKGHVRIGKFDISIEQPKGSVRRGVDANGRTWETKMNNTYGYIRGTESVDGDHIDVFLSDDIDNWDGQKVFVVDQYNEDGSFDEHKVMLGFNDINEAYKAYLSNYENGWADKHTLRITQASLEEFEKWIDSSNRKTKEFSEYKKVKKETVANNPATYTIEPAQYTTKRGKVLDMHLVKFADTLSKEQYRAAKELAKAERGWYDAKQGGFMMRSEESARQLAETVVGNKEAVADAQPVSLADINKVTETRQTETAEQQTKEAGQSEVRILKGEKWEKTGKPEKFKANARNRADSRDVKWKIGKQLYGSTRAERDLIETVSDMYGGFVGAWNAYENDKIMLSENEAAILKALIEEQEAKTAKEDDIFSQAERIAAEVERERLSKQKKKPKSNPSGNKLVTDERYAELRERLRKKLNNLNVGIDPEILSIGIEMAVYHLEKGSRKFADYATAMIADLGDVVRPYLKAFYNGARDLPEVESSDFATDLTPYNEVQEFDIATFGKEHNEPMTTAEVVVAEQAHQEEAEQAKQEIISQRNSERKANEGYNGFKRGDKVLFTPQGRNKKTVEATIYDFEDYGDHNPILDTGLAPILYETVEWSDIKPVENKTKSGEKQSKEKSLPLQQTGELSLSDGSIKNNKDGLQRDDAALRSKGLSADSDRNAGAGSRTGNLQEVQQDTGRVDRRGENGNGRAGSGKTQSDGVFVRPLQQLEGKNSRNNHSERGKDHAPTSVDARIEANFKAVELAKQLLESGEEATEEQKEVLRKFSGWGGLGKVFDEHANYSHNGRSYYNEPTLENKRLRELLSEEEYQQALMSANSAYYTPAYVIDTLWDIAEQMGFKGGNILEGSAGIGNILGQMPASISANSDIQAVEIDGISGAILSLLYPDAKVEIQGFEQTRVPNGSVDLAVTNVPFVTGLRVNDTTGDNDLSKKFHNIHDFCIAKNVRKLREGGLGIFITSSGTLDNSRKLRDWVVNEGEADFVGAFRMNNKTFGGTGVTSDIIVIRKRVNGRKSAQAIDVSTVTGERVAEYDTGEKRKVKGQYEPVVKNLSMDYNTYFMEHPERMAGEMRFGFEEGNRYRPTSKGLYPKQGTNQKELLSEFVKSFTQEEVGERSTEEKKNDEVAPDKKVGEMFVKDGKLYINSISNAQLLDVNSNKVKGHTKAECFEAYSAIKKALADVLAYQTENESDDGLKPLLDKLNKAYDDFVETYGHFNKNTAIAFLRNDVDYANVSSVETYKEQGDGKGGVNKLFGKADVMDKRVVEKVKEPNPTNVKEGIVASVFKFGHVDVPYIAERLGRSIDDVKNEIIENGYGFEDPVTRKVEASYQYLSGNVREKLSQAEANNENGEFDRNIKALQEKIPMDIPAHLIDFTLGSSWIDPELYDEYVKERTGVDAKFTLVGGTWFMKEPSSTDYEKNRAMGVKSKVLNSTTMGHELIEAAIQNKTITVSTTRKNWDGKSETITDKDATQACANKIDEIRQDFKDWAKQKMQSDPDMSAKMERVYNDTFNNFVPMSIPDEFAPEHFAGANPRYTMRPHQSKAIVRGTQQSVLLAHEVGTGKTFTLISTAMEMRRLGTARKPMIVVQNATVGQFVADAKELYPNAKILMLEDNDRNVEGRKNFYAKIRYNDWDMIIVPQSVFERIPDSEDRQYQYIKEKIDEKVTSILQMKEQDPYGDSLIVKQAEQEVERLEEELAELSSVAVKKNTAAEEKKRAVAKQNAEVRAMEMLDRMTDDVENFDDMGIDALLVDEAHEYKHLGFATAMQRGVKGVDPSYSKKSQGVFLKAQAVMEKNNGRNVVFATGTPISNTAAEIWTFMRYLMPADTMKEYGIYYFDDFVRNFGNIQQMLEFTTSGKFKENNRFAGYVNLPELVRIWSGVSDTVLTEEAPEVMEKIPELEGGKAQDIYLPQTRALRSVMKFVKSELERFDNMSGKEKKANSHIPLTMYGIAKAAAVDARLVQADAEDDPNSKTNEAVRQTLRSLKETADYNGTVAIFADNYQNKASGFNLYEDIRAKLIAEGVPADEIVVIKSGMTVKKKAAIFDKFNHGEVRVLLGSTFTLGTGVNIQERLHTLIHLDAPNRPMDYTQRNGRILRQGNIHKEMGKPVRVLRFGVEDSLDVTAYQRLKTKGAIADSIMRGRQMMENSMVNRVLEEEEDVFGDTIAQLSGSEYAMLKNNAEKNMRKYASRKKQYEADQTYIHNAKPKLKGLIREAEQRIEDNGSYLKAVQSAFQNGRFGEISVGKQRFASVEAMEDFFKDYNKKALADMQKIKSGEITGDQRRELTIRIGDFDFVVTTDLSRKTASEGRTLFTQAERKMTYSCPELGIENTPVKQNLLRNAVEDITTNVLTGKDFSEQLEAAQRSKRHNEAELEQMLSREGKPFEYEKELKQAQAQYEEYSELMKKELEEKEAKYADMDASVETADGITSTEEDEEENNGDTLYRSDEDYTIETVNEKFNEELQQQIDGTLPQGHIYQIGMPGFILQSAGFPHLPIELSSTRLSKKASQENHIFDISEVKDLVKELNNPLAVFRYGDNAKNVIIGIEHNGKQFLVGVHFNQERNGLDISSIRGVFPKTNAKWLNWIVQGKAEYLNKEKIQTLIDQQRTNLADVDYLDLDSVAKIVKDFENPTNTDDIRFRGGDRFFNGINADDLFDLLNEYSSYSFGAYELIDSLEKYYGGELISASSGAKHAIERGFVPKPGHKYSGLDGEYHHIEFQDENGDTFVEAVPFIEAKNVESDLGIKFGKEDKNRVPLTKEEKVLRDAVIDRIRRSGIEVIDDPAVGQRVLDMANGNAKEQAKKKRALETASLRATPRSLTVISSADGAKILQNIEELANELTESVSQPKTFVGKVAQALGATRDGSKSEYATFETKNGKVVTIRLADHNAKVSNFDRRNELSGISIVVSPKVNTGMTNDGDAHIVEYYYDAIKLRKAEGKPLAEIVRSIQQALYSGEFKDTTGLAERQEVNADNLREHRVYHGSGAEFEAFDHSYMGEGEGQQAYGWGTYVTEVEGIGEYYAKTSFLIAEEKRRSSRKATPVSMAVGAIIHQENYNLQAVSFEQRKEAAIADLETNIKINENILRNEKEDETMTALRKAAIERNKAALDALRAMREEQYNEERSRQGRIRHLYTVEIPEDNGNNYLEWNEPLPKDFDMGAVGEFIMREKRIDDETENEMLEKDLSDSLDEVYNGRTLYRTISLYIGEKEASELLASLGYVGIKYPADNLRGGRADGAKNYVVFNERDLQIVDHVRFFKGANGEAYGFTVDGKIYIDTRIANTETPIHEYAHLWAEALRNGNAKEWNNVVGLMKGTSVWEEVTKRYPELKSDDEIAEEVIALYSGRRGAERLREETRKATEGENSVFEKAEAVNALQRVKRALEKFWKGIADFLHIHYTSATEVADRVMRDLLNEVNPINTDISARDGVASYTDDELSFENDPWSKLAGRPLRTQFQRKEFARKERRRMVDRVNELAEKLHLGNVEIVTDADALEGKKKRAKGFYSKSTGKITIVIPNHTSTFDAEQTLLHEAVAHYGLRQLFGEHFDTFLDNVFTNADMQVREQIVALATRNGWDFRTATEEYLASLAENTNFENLNAGWWSKIKQLFMDLLHKIGFDGFGGVALSDNELRYILWRSYQNLVSPGKYKSILGEAEDIAKQYDLKVGDYAETKEFSDKAAEKEDELMFRDIDPDNEFVVKDRAYAAHIYNQRVKGGMYQFKEAMQDSMLGLKELMGSVYEANGKKDFNIADVPTFENAYTGENALSSINEKEVEAFNRTFFQPLNVVISKLATTADERDELIEYMMAKHGLERNVYMAERDAKSKLEKSGKSEEELEKMIEKNRQRDYAGLTALTGIEDVAEAELEAERMVAEYESMHETEPIWDLLKEINDAILSKSLECGLISKETYEAISSMYNYYIPLRGFDEKTADEEYAYLNERHGTFNAPIKKANGRRSKADNPLAYLQSMAESTIMQGNRNRFVKNRFLTFVLNHPSDAYSISDLWLQYDDVAGEWKPLLPTLNESDTPEEVERKLAEFNDKLMQLAEEEPEKYKRGREADNIPYRVVNNSDLHQHQVIVKRRGKNVVITINGNPRAAQALNGLTNPDNNDMRGSIGSIISLVGDVNRTLSALYTTLQPDFIASNFLRDLIYSNSMAFVKEGADYWRRFALNYFVNAWSLKGLFAKYRKGTLDTNNRVEAMFKQFLDNGGETGYRRMLDVEEHKKEIEKALKTLNKKMPFEEWRKHFANWLDEIGRSVETKARFAAFMTSRSLGRDIGRSIFDAKEISVNFNKKGAGDRFLKSQGQTLLGKSGAFVSGAGRTLFIFWNAAIQGTFGNFGKALSQHPGRSLSVASALFVLGMFIQKLVSDGDDGDDDKRGSYYDLPETIRRNNFVFPGPGKSWIKVPLPIEYQAIYGMGELLGGKMFHNEPLSVAEFASQISKLTPIDIMEGQTNNKDGLDLLAPFTPSAIKPMLEVQKNRSWYGLPIYKDTPFNKNMPEWTKAYKNANTKIVDLCAYLNEMSGGTRYEKGKVDLNPAEIEYLLRSYGGGFWTLPNQLVKLYEAGVGKDFDWRNIPLVNRFVTNGDERTKNRALNNEFFQLEEEYKETMRLIKAYEKDKAQGDKKAVKRLQEIKKSKEYAHLAAFDDKNLYSKIKKSKKMLKEATTKEEEDKLKKELNELKKQVVKKVRLIDAL